MRTTIRLSTAAIFLIVAAPLAQSACPSISTCGAPPQSSAFSGQSVLCEIEAPNSLLGTGCPQSQADAVLMAEYDLQLSEAEYVICTQSIQYCEYFSSHPLTSSAECSGIEQNRDVYCNAAHATIGTPNSYYETVCAVYTGAYIAHCQ
jgi:hypothetical protein